MVVGKTSGRWKWIAGGEVESEYRNFDAWVGDGFLELLSATISSSVARDDSYSYGFLNETRKSGRHRNDRIDMPEKFSEASPHYVCYPHLNSLPFRIDQIIYKGEFILPKSY